MAFKLADNVTVLTDADGALFVDVSGDTMTGALVVDGSSDTIQLRVQGHSTQTNPIVTFEKSDGTDLLFLNNDGGFGVGAGAVVSGARAIAMGQSAWAYGNDSVAIRSGFANLGAIGIGGTASGENSVNIAANVASGDYSIAVGSGSKAQGFASLALGTGFTESNATQSTGIGTWVKVSGNYSVAIGSGDVVGNSYLTNNVSDSVLIGANNVRAFWAYSTSLAINEDGADYDFRIEGDSDANLFFVDAGNDRVGIGTNAPGAKLDVRGSAIFNEDAADVDFRIEGDSDANLFFVDASTDRIGISTNAPEVLFHVDGAGAFGNSVTNARASRPLNLIATDATMRVWRYTATTSSHPAVELVWGTATNPGDSGNYFWDFYIDAADGSFKIRDRTAGASNNWVSVAASGVVTLSGGLAIADAKDIALGTTTGTKIGTATSQKIGIWNATPIVQPTTGVGAATFTANAGTAVNDSSTFESYTLKQVVKALRNIGLLA